MAFSILDLPQRLSSNHRADGGIVHSGSRSESAVWYIEARPFKGTETAPGLASEEPPIRGSGVVVQLEVLQQVEQEGNSRWVSFTPPRYRKYLLTCAHVVRGFDRNAPGWFPIRGEILCWRPTSPFRCLSPNDPPRRSGDAHRVGAHRANVAFGPLPGTDAVAPIDATAINDWILLEVEDSPHFVFQQQADAANGWLRVDRGARGLSLSGYPGGSEGWSDEDPVIPGVAEGFRVKKKGGPGCLVLQGPDESRPGMSGGAVVDRQGRLIGIHRAATDSAMERIVVSAEQIEQWLEERGLRPAPAGIPPGTDFWDWIKRHKSLASIVVMGVAYLLIWMMWPQMSPVDVQATIQVDIPEVHLSLTTDGKNALKSEWTDAKGKARFDLKVSVWDRLLNPPIYIRVDTMVGDKPLMVTPYGISRDGKFSIEAGSLRQLVSLSNPLHIEVCNEDLCVAREMSKQGASSSEMEQVKLVEQVEKVSTNLHLSPAKQHQVLAAWADKLKTDTPVVVSTDLHEPDADRIKTLAHSVGAFFESGNQMGTGFVVSDNVVLVPSFTPIDDSKSHSITFSDRTDSPSRVTLGRVIWRSKHKDAPASLLEAHGPLPPPLQLNNVKPQTVATDRRICVIGYPQRDGRTPLEFQQLFNYTRRNVMFGSVVKGKETQNYLWHNAMTAGGTAGGPVVDRETGTVIAVHLGGSFAGSLQKLNFAGPIGRLLEDPEFQQAMKSVARPR